MRERREKRFYIDSELMFDLICDMIDGPKPLEPGERRSRLYTDKCAELEGCSTMHVGWSAPHFAWEIVVSHPEWDIVPPGRMIPEFDPVWQRTVVEHEPAEA